MSVGWLVFFSWLALFVWALTCIALPREALVLSPRSWRDTVGDGNRGLLRATYALSTAISVAYGMSAEALTPDTATQGGGWFVGGLLAILLPVALSRIASAARREVRVRRTTSAADRLELDTTRAADYPELRSLVRPVTVARRRFTADRLLRRVRVVGFAALPFTYVIGQALTPTPAYPGAAQERGWLTPTLCALSAVAALAPTLLLRLTQHGTGTDDLRRLAAQRGWLLRVPDTGRIARSLPAAPLLRPEGTHHLSEDLRSIEGRTGPWRWWAVEQQGLVASSDRKEWEHLPRRSSWVVHLPGAQLPGVTVEGRDGRPIRQWAPGNRFELEAFDRTWHVDAVADAAAHAILHPRMLETIQRAMPDGGRLTFRSDVVCLTIDGPLRDVTRNADLVVALADLVPRWLLRDARPSRPLAP